MTRLTCLFLSCLESGKMLPPATRAIVEAPVLWQLTIAIHQELRDIFVGPPIGVQPA